LFLTYTKKASAENFSADAFYFLTALKNYFCHKIFLNGKEKSG